MHRNSHIVGLISLDRIYGYLVMNISQLKLKRLHLSRNIFYILNYYGLFFLYNN